MGGECGLAGGLTASQIESRLCVFISLLALLLGCGFFVEILVDVRNIYAEGIILRSHPFQAE
jgi:hypothetical protein